MMIELRVTRVHPWPVVLIVVMVILKGGYLAKEIERQDGLLEFAQKGLQYHGGHVHRLLAILVKVNLLARVQQILDVLYGFYVCRAPKEALGLHCLLT